MADGRARDHPRVCGEHAALNSVEGRYEGSSPRMRGAPLCSIDPFLAQGIIPAYAGSTRPGSRRARSVGDHPRVCGEHRATSTSYASWWGSSPRMRGARAPQHGGRPVRGIIPAYAGSTHLPKVSSVHSRDHPRVCGEHSLSEQDWRSNLGSSPRMRGARLLGGGAVELRGIIPAYAGSTASPCCPAAASRDHPRVCGEHGPSDTGAVYLRDHPRVCGEHIVAAVFAAMVEGSSPRMRGAPLLVGARDGGEGIIPAYAGSTALQRQSY